MTFEELVKMEPRLGELLLRATTCNHAGHDFCANEMWYGAIKPRLLRLVGFSCKPGPHCETLSSSESYELAYRTIYDSLPPCRGRCGCL